MATPSRQAGCWLARTSHNGQARHRAGRDRSARRRPKSVAWAPLKAFDAAGGPELSHVSGATPLGGGSRPTGRVKALARCDSIARRAFPCLSADSRRAAPVHCEKFGLGYPLSGFDP